MEGQRQEGSQFGADGRIRMHQGLGQDKSNTQFHTSVLRREQIHVCTCPCRHVCLTHAPMPTEVCPLTFLHTRGFVHARVYASGHPRAATHPHDCTCEQASACMHVHRCTRVHRCTHTRAHRTFIGTCACPVTRGGHTRELTCVCLRAHWHTRIQTSGRLEFFAERKLVTVLKM